MRYRWPVLVGSTVVVGIAGPQVTFPAPAPAVVSVHVGGVTDGATVGDGRGTVVVGAGAPGYCHGWPLLGLPPSSTGVQYAAGDPSRIGVQNMYQPP
jgi:hypothetical protein